MMMDQKISHISHPTYACFLRMDLPCFLSKSHILVNSRFSPLCQWIKGVLLHE